MSAMARICEALAELNGVINLSPNENIFTIPRIKTFIILYNTHYTIFKINLFDI